VSRAAHHDDVGLELLSQFALFRERREVVLISIADSILPLRLTAFEPRVAAFPVTFFPIYL
jgi:hypothetical protein